MVFGSAAEGAIVFALVPAAVVVGLKEAPSVVALTGMWLASVERDAGLAPVARRRDNAVRGDRFECRQ